MDVLVVRSVAHWEEAGLKGSGPAHIFHTLPVEMPWESVWTLNGTRIARTCPLGLLKIVKHLAEFRKPKSRLFSIELNSI